MKRATKIWLITAVLLIVTGGAVFCGAMSKNNWDFSDLDKRNYDTRTVSITEDFKNISIACNTEDVSLLPSEDGKCSVVFYETEKETHTAVVTDGTLSIELLDKREWYDHISFFSFDTPKITLYLPKTKYDLIYVGTDTGDVSIATEASLPEKFKFGKIEVSTDTGDIRCENIGSGDVKLSVSTGQINVDSTTCEGTVEIHSGTGDLLMRDVSCKTLTANGGTGDVTLDSVLAEEMIAVKLSTGDVTFKSCDAAGLAVITSTGDIKGSLITDKTFVARSSTGRVDVPENTSGGKAVITTNTGDISITVIT